MCHRMYLLQHCYNYQCNQVHKADHNRQNQLKHLGILHISGHNIPLYHSLNPLPDIRYTGTEVLAGSGAGVGSGVGAGTGVGSGAGVDVLPFAGLLSLVVVFLLSLLVFFFDSFALSLEATVSVSSGATNSPTVEASTTIWMLVLLLLPLSSQKYNRQ